MLILALFIVLSLGQKIDQFWTEVSQKYPSFMNLMEQINREIMVSAYVGCSCF